MDDELNREFKRLLQLSGWTQSRAAEELSVDVATVNRYVAGSVKPSRTILKLMAAIRGEQLLLDGVPRQYQPTNGTRYLEAYEREFLDRVQQFHPVQRREILKGLDAVLGAVANPVTFASGPAGNSTPGINSGPGGKSVGEMVDDFGSAFVHSKRKRAKPSK